MSVYHPNPQLYQYCSNQIQRRPSSLAKNPPWTNGKEYVSQDPFLQLHAEILDFTEWILPTEEEVLVRMLVIRRIRNMINLLWPNAKVIPHGSTATRTFLPGGDIDFVVMDPPPQYTNESLMNTLNEHLRNLSLFDTSNIISGAKCPIIKCIEKPYGFKLDIAINNENGVLNIERNISALKKYPALLPMLMLTKVYVNQHQLDEPYKGGISTNTLIQMNILNIQMMEPEYRLNLGRLALSFFDIFGNTLNYVATGFTTRGGGRLFNRFQEHQISWKTPINFCIEDPQMPGNFLGTNAFEALKFHDSCHTNYILLKSDLEKHSVRPLNSVINSVTQYEKSRNKLAVDYQQLMNRTPVQKDKKDEPEKHLRLKPFVH